MTPPINASCGIRSLALKRIEYILLTDVARTVNDTIVNEDWNRQEDISPAGGTWETLPTLPFPRWEESTNNGGHGTVYQNQITGQVPQLSRGNSRSMDALSRNRLLLRLTDINDAVWMVGSHQEGLKLSYQRSGGGAGSFAGYSVTISGRVTHAATQ